MTIVLLATDSDHIFAEVDATLATDECEVLRVRKGAEVLPVVEAKNPDLVLLDLQIGSMGGVATCIAIRQEEGTLRLEERAIGLLLDREADAFLAEEAGADGWLIKPLDSLRLRKLSKELLSGGSVFEGRPQSPATEMAPPEADEAQEEAADEDSEAEAVTEA